MQPRVEDVLGSYDHYHSKVLQSLEKPPQNHGIGNVSHLLKMRWDSGAIHVLVIPETRRSTTHWLAEQVPGQQLVLDLLH